MRKDEKNTAIYVANEEYVPWDPVEPERNLLRAILMSALNDIQKGGVLEDDAMSFFLSEEEDYVFSFKAICDFLELDPQQVLILTGLFERDGSPSLSYRDRKSYPVKFV
ncbi:MAG: hypothetical protein KDD70_11840 [Bdellovibrionales bacterium]|nr:hypothetical protein [Bdellovibrionales bacterium]